MKAQILTEDQIPEALSIARGVFDYCLRARITDLEMIHIFLQYTENTNIRHMIAEGTLTMWGIFEQGHMIAMSGMQRGTYYHAVCASGIPAQRMWQMSVGRNEGVCGKSISVTEGDVIGNAGMDSGLFYQTPVSSNGGNTAVFVCSDAGKNRGTRDI